MPRYTLLFFSLCLLLAACSDDAPSGDRSGIDIAGTSSIEAHGFDIQLFSRAQERIQAGDFGQISSLVIIHEDDLVHEQYFEGWNRQTPHIIQSSTKSITSLLVGIAMDMGYFESTDESVHQIFAGYDIQQLDAQKRAMTMEHLLTMTAGFDWDEWTLHYENPENDNNALKRSEDWISFVLDQPMTSDPGEQFVYNSGVSILLGEAVRIKTGRKLTDFAEDHLFGPLKVRDYDWISNGEVADCGGGLFLRPIDMAKIGYLMLNKGQWAGEQIVSEQWVEASFMEKAEIGFRFQYGYQWWLFDPALDVLSNIGHASGNGGQFIFIIEDLNMVLVLTGEHYNEETKHSIYDLLFAILVSEPQYQRRVFDRHEWIMSIDPTDFSYADIEYMNIAYELIQLSAADRALEVLDKLSVETNDDNWFYHFLYGWAHFELGAREEAEWYLNEHLRLNERQSIHQQAYADWARALLDQI